MHCLRQGRAINRWKLRTIIVQVHRREEGMLKGVLGGPIIPLREVLGGVVRFKEAQGEAILLRKEVQGGAVFPREALEEDLAIRK